MPSRLRLAATSWSKGKLHQLLSSKSLLKVLARELLHRKGLNHGQLVCRSNQHSPRRYTVQWTVLNGLAAFKLEATSPILMEIVANIIPSRRDTPASQYIHPQQNKRMGVFQYSRASDNKLELVAKMEFE